MTQEASGETFLVDKEKCVGCGDCAADCVAFILEMRDKRPVMKEDREEDCIGCEHCLTVCPTGAVSILGLDPADSDAPRVPGVDPEALGNLFKMRRSCRRFSPEPVDPALLDKILDLVAYAPTGVNYMARQFTVIRDKPVMDEFRRLAADAVIAAGAAGAIPEEHEWLAHVAQGWKEGKSDVLFRGAPHMLVVSSRQDAPCSIYDNIIALSYFDILANAHGIGTVWAGIPFAILSAVAPALREVIGIPEDHKDLYVVLFGNPAIRYRRSAQRRPEKINIVREIRG